MVNEVGKIASLPVAMPPTSLGAVAGLPAAARPVLPVTGGGSAGVQAVVSGLHAQISQVKDRLAETALNIRGAHHELERADDLLDELQSNLTRIVKQYPPFAQESPQRLAYLNAITGLRKQLEALAFPPESRQAEVSLPANSGLDWVVATLPQPARPEPGDLAVPELSPDAADGKLVEALGIVGQARERIGEMKAAMWADVARFAAGADADHALDRAGEVRAYVAQAAEQGIGAVAPRGVMTAGL